MTEIRLVTCGHCSKTFPFDNSNNYIPRCPHCRKVSSIDSKFARRRGIFYLVLGILSLCMGIGIATGIIGYSETGGGILEAYGFILVLTLFLFACANYYCRLKLSVFSSDDPV